MKEEAIGALEQVRDESPPRARGAPLPVLAAGDDRASELMRRDAARRCAVPGAADDRPRRDRLASRPVVPRSRSGSTRCSSARPLIVVLVLALRRGYPDETLLREPAPLAPRRSAPTSLGRIEHEVALGVAGSFDLHFRLVPRLRTVAAGLLNSRRRVSLETSPDTARALLGDDAWALVRPDRPTPQDRLGQGIAPSDLGRAVGALEAL